MITLKVIDMIWPSTIIDQHSYPEPAIPQGQQSESISPHAAILAFLPNVATGSNNPLFTNPNVQYYYGGTNFNGGMYNVLDPMSNPPELTVENGQTIIQTNYYFPRPYNGKGGRGLYLQTTIYCIDETTNLPMSLPAGVIDSNIISCVPANKLNLNNLPGNTPPLNLNGNKPYYEFLESNGEFQYPSNPPSYSSPVFSVKLKSELGFAFDKWFNIDTLKDINSATLTIPADTELNVIACFKNVARPHINYPGEGKLEKEIIILGDGGVIEVIPGDAPGGPIVIGSIAGSDGGSEVSYTITEGGIPTRR